MLTKMFNILKNEGVSGVVARVRHRMYLKTFLYKTTIPEYDDALAGYPFTTLPLSEDLIAAMAREHPTEFTKEKKQQFSKTLVSGSTDRVYVTIDSTGESMNHSCVSYADNYEPRLRYKIISIPENVYIFDCYTFEKHRNKGVQKFSILSLFKEARLLGCKTATCMIDEGNFLSEKVFMATGFERIGHVATYNFLFFKKTIKNGARFFIDFP